MTQVLEQSAAGRREGLVEPLIAAVAEYNPDVDSDLIRQAFAFSLAAHEGQQRRSGEPFIHHPLGVAQILAELRLDDATIAAALLHDVVEDTGAVIDQVRAQFGEEIA